MSASDDYLRGRRDAIDEVLHLMSEYAMAGGNDRELRCDLQQVRDEAARALAARLKGPGHKPKCQEGRASTPARPSRTS